VAIVLGAPPSPQGGVGELVEERVRAGLELWRTGLVTRLLVSGGVVKGGPPEAHGMAALARALGLPDGALLVEDRSRSTRENAERCRELMRERGLSTAILVSQPYHLRRAVAFFERAGVLVSPYVIENSQIFSGGTRSQRALRWIVREYALLALYRARGRITLSRGRSPG
jgi:uncharacterized SAM-binding protein YcdF (DUF218 family)